MMNCKDYIFKLTSGQLEEAGWLVRTQAAQHRMICRRCRAFTRNDQALDGILAGYEAHKLAPEPASEGAEPDRKAKDD